MSEYQTYQAGSLVQKKTSEIFLSNTKRLIDKLLGSYYRKSISAPQLSDQMKSEIRSLSLHVDVDFYLKENPDVANSKTDPLWHYCAHGWREGRDPSPDFSTNFYLKAHRDVAAAQVNPFWHYIVAGKAEMRDIAPSGRLIHRSVEQAKAGSMIDVVDYFDASLYLDENTDVERAGLDPLTHYWECGWREGRNPSRSFSTRYYLESNPDVAAAGINPFWHYIVAGKEEGRLAQHPGGYRARTLIEMNSSGNVLGRSFFEADPEIILTKKDFRARVKNALDVDHSIDELIICFSHDNYTMSTGGVQFCIDHEASLARRLGLTYLNLYPYRPLQMLASSDPVEDVLVSAILDGCDIGTLRMSDVIAAFEDQILSPHKVKVIVHHLMGHSPEQITELTLLAAEGRCYFWLHDFFSLCPSYTLQRNTVSYCGAPPLASNSCTLCIFGTERGEHKARLNNFFKNLVIKTISPSEFTSKFWSKKTDLVSSEVAVTDHMRLSWNKRVNLIQVANGPVNIAFVGTPAPHKGWHEFVRIVNEHQDGAFRFFSFGTSETKLSGAEYIPVRVSADQPDAMIRALSENDVDIVLHWPTWPETFSFSTHEALAAGAYVLTNESSGNVAAVVTCYNAGVVLKDQIELDVFFKEGLIHDLANQARARRSEYEIVTQLSDMTFSAL